MVHTPNLKLKRSRPHIGWKIQSFVHFIISAW